MTAWRVRIELSDERGRGRVRVVHSLSASHSLLALSDEPGAPAYARLHARLALAETVPCDRAPSGTNQSTPSEAASTLVPSRGRIALLLVHSESIVETLHIDYTLPSPVPCGASAFSYCSLPQRAWALLHMGDYGPVHYLDDWIVFARLAFACASTCTCGASSSGSKGVQVASEDDAACYVLESVELRVREDYLNYRLEGALALSDTS